jgi:chorismate dehydratase
MTTRLRIGGVPYGVGDPLLVGLEHQPDVDFVREKPRRLVDGLREGRLDAALVSSIEAFRRPGYRVVPHLGICCDGPVRSVRAFTRRGIDTIRTVGLDDGSEASVALLRIFLADGHFGPISQDLAFDRIDPTPHPDTLPHDLVLLIGDIGLAATTEQRDVTDLGDAWKQRTQLPFVFALWLLAPDAPADRITPVLLAAAERGARAGAGTTRPDGTHHTRGEAEDRALDLFHQRAAALGLCDPDIHPHYLSS